MFGTPSVGEGILIMVMWLLPFIVAYWVLRTLARISHNIERVATAVEGMSTAKRLP